MYKHTKLAAAFLAILAMLSSAAGTAMAAEPSGFDDPPATAGGVEPEEQRLESQNPENRGDPSALKDPEGFDSLETPGDSPFVWGESDPDAAVFLKENGINPSTSKRFLSNRPFVTRTPASGLTDQKVYDSMVALKKQYPEGMTWTNFEPYGTKGELGSAYQWKGGKVKGSDSGVGCAAFAFLLSDAAFDNLPARTMDKGGFTFDDIRAGDILRVNGNSHFVIVLQKSVGGVVVAEANYNKSVHWGRAMSQSEVMDADFVITRYPEDFVPADDPDADKTVGSGKEGNISWTLTQAGTLTLSGHGAIPDFDINSPPAWDDHKGSIHTILIENGITGIGNYAFYQSSALNVYLPNSVTMIGQNAFQNSQLIAVTLPSSVKTIGNDAFRNCANLTSASIPEGLATIGERAFQGCTALTHIDFPASVTSVGAGAFASCEKMTSVRFMPSDHPVTIGDNVFSQCWRLMDVTLPKNSTCISAGMFSSCSSLPSLYIPASVTEIGANPFTSCRVLQKIYFGGSKDAWEKIVDPQLAASLTSTHTTVEFNVNFDDPFAPDPNDPGDNFTNPGDSDNPSDPGGDTGSGSGTPDNPSTPDDPGNSGGSGGSTAPRPSHKKRRPTTSTPAQPSEPTVPVNPPATPGSKPPVLDTVAAQAAVGGSYCFLVNGNHDLANLNVEVLNPQIASVTLENPNDPRGAMFRVTGKAPGTTQIRITYRGQSTLMPLTLQIPKGSISLDTASYTFAPGAQYTIGATLSDANGNVLTDEEIQQLLLSGTLRIRDSRTGSIADLQVLPNGNACVTAKHPGTCYILYEIEGKQISVRIDVQEGTTPHGQSVRATSFWI